MTNETKSRKRRSVLWYAGRLAALVCLAISTVQAAEVTITVKGTVALDSPDDYGIFQVGKDLKGQAFTLTITFDDSKSVVRVTNGSSVSEISQNSGSSPARVVLKIGPGSYVFGTKPESKWSAYKSTDPKSGCCGGIGFHVMEGIYPQTSLLWLKLEPAIGGKPLYGSVQWQTPISSARLDGDPMASQFRITRPGDYQRVTRGRLMPQSMTEGPGNGADSAQVNDAPAKNGEQAAIVDPSGGLSGTSTKGAGRSEETRAGDGIIMTTMAFSRLVVTWPVKALRWCLRSARQQTTITTCAEIRLTAPAISGVRKMCQRKLSSLSETAHLYLVHSLTGLGEPSEGFPQSVWWTRSR